MTKKQLIKNLTKNVGNKFNGATYTFEMDQFTEDFVREYKDIIDLDELFDRRNSTHSKPKFSKDFLSELKDEKNFGEWMSRESGLARYVRTGDCTDLNTDIIDAFKDNILNYAKTLDADGYDDYTDFYDRCYDGEMKQWLKERQE